MWYSATSLLGDLLTLTDLTAQELDRVIVHGVEHVRLRSHRQRHLRLTKLLLLLLRVIWVGRVRELVPGPVHVVMVLVWVSAVSVRAQDQAQIGSSLTFVNMLRRVKSVHDVFLDGASDSVMVLARFLM